MLRQLTQAKDVADEKGIALRTSIDQVVSAQLGCTRAAGQHTLSFQSSREFGAHEAWNIEFKLTIWCAHVTGHSTQ